MALSRDSFRPSTLGLRWGTRRPREMVCGFISQNSSPLGTHTRETTITTRGNLLCLCIGHLYVGVGVFSRSRSPPPRPRLGGAIPPISLGAVQFERIVADKKIPIYIQASRPQLCDLARWLRCWPPTKTSRIHLASAGVGCTNESSRPALVDFTSSLPGAPDTHTPPPAAGAQVGIPRTGSQIRERSGQESTPTWAPVPPCA
jgi:hypothetical protein